MSVCPHPLESYLFLSHYVSWLGKNRVLTRLDYICFVIDFKVLHIIYRKKSVSSLCWDLSSWNGLCSLCCRINCGFDEIVVLWLNRRAVVVVAIDELPSDSFPRVVHQPKGPVASSCRKKRRTMGTEIIHE
jgi:hypothetical protein